MVAEKKLQIACVLEAEEAVQKADALVENAIKYVADNSESLDIEVGFSQVVDESCGYTEEYTIETNTKGDYCVMNENGYCVMYLQDLGFDEKVAVLKRIKSQL